MHATPARIPIYLKMEIKEMQEEAWKVIKEYNKKHGLEHKKETVFLHLIEEIGELARELAKETNDWRKEGFSKEKVEEELVDVLAQILYFAKDQEIDIEEAFKSKILKLRKRFELE